ncbi:sensor domain-containing protein [Teichococcus oryzae]|uniref:EAL domain-containing protein n=1 Tax=Teichococcus oryzae TaxID=1608942 RepID=A0A5B2THW9_9PROT|nr:GGDEF and EAL domain-containing protein [Pseudoroseomonas oryzae]KAA2213605.1 EAL domain-containing protein [Pseudoroseomonas oryzae]
MTEQIAKSGPTRSVLEAAHRRLSSLPNLYDAVPVGLCLIDADLRFASINKQMAEMMGRPAQEDIGRGLAEVAPGVAVQLEPYLRRALRGERVADLELQGSQTNGMHQGRTYLVSLEPARSKSEEIIGALCSVLDITARKQAEEALWEHQERLSNLIAQVAVGIAQIDLKARFLLVNDRYCEIVGRSRETLLQQQVLDITHPEDATESQTLLQQLVETGEPFTTEKRYTRPDGSSVWVSNYVSATRDPSGRPQFLVAIVQDITERKRAEMALRESEENYRYTVELSPEIPWAADADGQVTRVSPRWSRLSGMAPGDSLGTGWLMAVHPEDAPRMQAHWMQSVASGEPLDVDFRLCLADGGYRWFRSRAAARRDENGRIIRWYGTAEDIHERKLAVQQISYMAYHDPLTDLANRRLFHQEMGRMLTALRPGEHLALHFIDLDQFKGVNDTLGHAAGDALLRQVADRLRGCVPEGSLVARIGGDEFAVVQTGVREPDDAAALARHIVQILDEDYQIDERHAVVGASIGIALVSPEAAALEDVVRKADIALFRAKADGRGTFRFFEPAMDEVVRRKQELRVGLRTALDRGELELHFQPLVGIWTGEVTCFETLLRWQHPGRGMISPAEFIPVAEETGLIMRMGEWALRTACKEAARWPDAIRVAVNLSPVQFRNPGLVQAVANALEEARLDAGRLELEITESVLLQDDHTNFAVLHELSRLGVRIALDDFGTGFSSLAYLLRFPIDKIKIDRSFVTGLPDRRESKAVIRAVVSMSRSLGISVTAEGVETAGQLKALRQLGCNDAQGYLLSRPVPAAEVLALIGQPPWAEGSAA